MADVFISCSSVDEAKVNEILHEYLLDCDGMCKVISQDFGKGKDNE